MPRILIFNAMSEVALNRVVDAGAKPYDLLVHDCLGPTIEYFTLGVGECERLPPGIGIQDFDGVWISGSTSSVNDQHDACVAHQIELIREVWDKKIPAFGSCWGLQLMVAALGGTVRPNPRGREIGIARGIFLTDQGRRHPIFGGKPPVFDALCVHEDEILALPSCGTVLASNEFSPIQAAAMKEGDRSFWGVQYHPEFTLSVIAAVLNVRSEKLLKEGFVRTKEDVMAVATDFQTLDTELGRKDLAWKYGIGRDVLNMELRTTELRNWVNMEVLPFSISRR